MRVIIAHKAGCAMLRRMMTGLRVLATDSGKWLIARPAKEVRQNRRVEIIAAGLTRIHINLSSRA